MATVTDLTSFFNSLSLLEATVVVLVVAGGVSLFLEHVVLRVGRRFVGRTESKLDDIVFATLRIPVFVTIGLAAVFLLTRSNAVEGVVLEREQLNLFFGRPSLSVIVLVWGWALNRVVNRAVEEMKDAGPRYAFAPVFSNVWTLIVLVASAFVVLSIWGIEITPLLGAAGVAGVAIGFAAKDTVANFFGGMALYFDDTYKIGDYVVLDSGEAGTVVKVGIRSTTLRTRSETLVTVPNSVLNAAKVTNASAPGKRTRIELPIGVAYGTDIDAFEKLALGVAATESLALDSPKPRMRFREFGDSALNYELLCWVRGPTRENRARHKLNRALYKRLDEADIEIPFPQRGVTVHPLANPAAVPESFRPSADD
jgi:small-conductance mechanosensitive channel